jgi:hypothetical protein
MNYVAVQMVLQKQKRTQTSLVILSVFFSIHLNIIIGAKLAHEFERRTAAITDAGQSAFIG